MDSNFMRTNNLFTAVGCRFLLTYTQYSTAAGRTKICKVYNNEKNKRQRTFAGVILVVSLHWACVRAIYIYAIL